MRDRKMYFLDLQTLLTYLRGQSCELTTELNVSEKAARGSIFLKEGKIVHCLLNLHNGLQITGEQAYKQLETSTQWQVELEQPEEKKKTPLWHNFHRNSRRRRFYRRLLPHPH